MYAKAVCHPEASYCSGRRMSQLQASERVGANQFGFERNRTTGVDGKRRESLRPFDAQSPF